MSRLRTVYGIGIGWGGQAGSDITELKMTKKQYMDIQNRERGTYACFDGREYYAIVDNYISALYITQD